MQVELELFPGAYAIPLPRGPHFVWSVRCRVARVVVVVVVVVCVCECERVSE